jgi:sulfite reductase (NADPH) flavoprotein alpha-component
MAKDVDQALHEIAVSEGGMTPASAVDFVKQLKKDKRYQRDVY